MGNNFRCAYVIFLSQLNRGDEQWSGDDHHITSTINWAFTMWSTFKMDFLISFSLVSNR